MMQPSRKDDLISLAYVLIEMLGSLPFPSADNLKDYTYDQKFEILMKSKQKFGYEYLC